MEGEALPLTPLFGIRGVVVSNARSTLELNFTLPCCPPGFLHCPWVQVQGGCISGADQQTAHNTQHTPTHHTTHQTPPKAYSSSVPYLRHLFCAFMLAAGRDGSREEAAVTTQTVPSARTSQRWNALAELQHHTAPRGQRMARAGEERYELEYTAKFQKNPPLNWWKCR